MAFLELTYTPHQMAGMLAACDAYNSTLQPTKDADGNDVKPDLLDVGTYWDKVFADYSGDETEQDVFNRATESYCAQHGVTE